MGTTADYPAASDIFAIRTNDMGDTVWTRTFDFGAEPDIAYSVCAAPGGGFIIAATRMSTYYRMELLRITNDGNLMWNKEFYLYSWGEGRSVIATTDGGFMVAGSLNNDACLLKLDSAGTTQWAKTYPGSEGNSSVAYAVQQTLDGGSVVSGNQVFDDWLLRTDALGDTLWQHAFPYGLPMAVTPIDNGGYALCTTSYNNLIFLHADNGGNIPCDQLTIPTEMNDVTPNVSSPALTSGYLVGMGMPATVQGSGGAFTTTCESNGLAEVGTIPPPLVAPNPANDRCKVSFGTSHFDALEVLTMQGAVLRRMSTRGRSQMEVPLKDLAQGPYLIHLIGPLPQNLRLSVAR